VHGRLNRRIRNPFFALNEEETAMKSARWLLLAGGVIAMGFWSVQPCAGQAEQKAKGTGTVVKLDNLESRTPADWQEEKSTNSMRLKQFRLSPIGNDKDPAEVIIFYFGEGQGGSAQENVKRWKEFFKPPEGKKIEDVANVETMKVGEVPITYLDIHGTYLSRFPPFDPKAKITPRPNYRMLGIVFESKKGPYFIRMIGPADTVTHYKKGFDEWLKGFK
jgi:hypothetical protein